MTSIHNPPWSPVPRPIEVRAEPRDRLGVRFSYARDLVAQIKLIPGRKWHARAQCWSVPANTASLALLISKFREEDLRLAPEVDRLLPKSGLEGMTWRRLEPRDAIVPDQWWEVFRRMADELTLRGYSPRTRRAYLDQSRRFVEFARVRPRELAAVHLREYVRGLLEDCGLSHSYADQNVSAAKFLFAHVLHRPLSQLEIPRPKRQRKLPTVLSRQEVHAILATLENRKHRALLMLAYSGGLRVSELVSLKTVDVDPGRMMIHVRQAKGRKDRFVPLSKVALEAVVLYQRYHPDRGPWLFPGQRRGKHLVERTVQHVFSKARRLAKIEKPATVHTLRHSFATHLHESGIGLRYIQTLLGHKSPRTTEIYTHVSRADIGRIPNPLDQLFDSDPPDDDLP